jgi:hypothetical protein
MALGLNPGCNCNQHSTPKGPQDGGGEDLSGTADLSMNVGGADLSVAQDLSAVASMDMAQLTGGNNCTPPTLLTIAPSNQSMMASPGSAFSQTFTVTAQYSGGAPSADVTSQSFFTVSDSTIGSFSGAQLTWNGDHGGTVTINATNCGVTGTTTFNLDLVANIGADDGGASSSGMNEFNGPASTTPSSCQPTLLYPPDGILLPPNTNVIEVHFLDGASGGTANNLFEISFTNSVTNVNVYTTCSNASDPSHGMAVTNVAPATALNPGCIFQLSQAEWDYLARTNADRGPVTVSVRAVGCSGSNVYSTPNTRQISFAKDDLIGTLYYWSSISFGAAGKNYSGGIFSYDFGVRGQTATPVLTPTVHGNGYCVGCHTISRDGRKMIFDYDDNDADDEYGDVDTALFDIVTAQTSPSPLPDPHGAGAFDPGFHTWNRETTQFLLSDGQNNHTGKFQLFSDTGGTIAMSQADTARGTTPDWAPDDSAVLYAAPPANSTTYFLNGQDDEWFLDASIKSAPWDPVNKRLGTPTVLLQATGTQNFYYPTFSPEGSLIAYNYAPSGPNFHNPLARVQLIAANVPQPSPPPLDLAMLNATGNLTNSWPRFAPFVQTYQGAPLLWVTFSSTRSYGLRVSNDGNANCYPKESPSITCPGGATPTPSPCPYSRTIDTTPAPPCTHPQIWMAAIKLDATAVKNGIDVSWPAFWLPFQDLTHNNHLGQWAQQSFTGPCNGPGDCSAGQCCDNGGCTTCPSPQPSPPTCAVNGNCAPGLCCPTGACISCPQDGGTAPDAGPMMSGCNTCLDCGGQACINGACGACTDSTQCCAPYICAEGQCIPPVS